MSNRTPRERPPPQGPNLRHVERVLLTARDAKASLNSPVAASWRRCLKLYGLRPDVEIVTQVVEKRDLDTRLLHSRPALSVASVVVERLSTLVGKVGCHILVADLEGVVLDCRGARENQADARHAGLWIGANWNERLIGTNGIGTTLVDERPLTITGRDHFLACKTSISSTAAPLRDQRGKIVGALAIASSRAGIDEVTFAIFAQLVRDAARSIEGGMFRNAFEKMRIVLVPGDAGGGSAMIAVDNDDLVVGATRAARIGLGLDDRLIGQGIAAADVLNEGRAVRPRDDLHDAERAALRRTLARTAGNLSEAAAQLGISRTTLYRKMRRLALS